LLGIVRLGFAQGNPLALIDPKGERPQPSAGLQLWVGPEPTVNRVGDSFLDQNVATGFARRLDDLDRLASLGARCVRFPLLWERTEPAPGKLRWHWSDARMARLQKLALAPIVGLLHHGSGPAHTQLLDPDFPEKLADYAARVAERYPWVTCWTPVNEPVTTARFSGLYGHWYPHRRDDRSFVRALLNQVRGVVLAMTAIRAVNPQAQLVQTDDLGFIGSTRPLRYQADFENERRWLSFDLLCGRVDRRHPLWGYLLGCGATQPELAWFRAANCAPDIVGINAYITSERFLDHRLERYPQHLHGGNGRDAYADVEAVRVCGPRIGGFEARLREAAARFGLPVAVTEVHLGCTREEQMRWLTEAWSDAERCRASGIDVRAVTAWSAFGSTDWDSLLTRAHGHYEPGLWDSRSEPPRPTALATIARQLANGEKPEHPVLQVPGWWHRSERLLYRAHGRVGARRPKGRRLVIVGATGTLGAGFARICQLRGIPYHLLGRGDMDIANPESVRAALARYQPWAVINTAGYVRVDDAEQDERQWRENALGPAVLAEACAQANVRVLTFSSDLVFDGEKPQPPYVESDEPNPLNAYGRGKRAGELNVLAMCPSALVIRTAAFFGPWDRYNFVTLALQTLRRGMPLRAASDQCVSPTYVPDLVNTSLDLLVDGESGLWHVANRGMVSWAELAGRTAQAAGLNAGLIEPVMTAMLGLRAPRPRNVPLASERGTIMPTLDQGIECYLRDVHHTPRFDPADGWPFDASRALRQATHGGTGSMGAVHA
jgi:dTDP-4-dehydrorhamnose reductase